MSVAHPRPLAGLAAFAGAAALLAAGVAAAHGATGVQAASRSGGTVVKLHQTAFGKVLADARGRTLYLFTPDKGRASACYGQCAAAWPPLLVHGKLAAAAGLKQTLLGQTMRKDGTHQVTYAGHPLYLFVKDRKAGQALGEGVQKVWWVVSAAGRKVTSKASAGPTASASVQLRSTGLGPVLVDARGLTLYLYTPDGTGASTCYGGCATAWPPLLAHGTPVAGKGLKGSLLGTTKRTDGTLQVTYAGHPLYLFAKDVKPGDTTGQAVGGVWYALSATGAKVDAATQTTTGGYQKGGNGY